MPTNFVSYLQKLKENRHKCLTTAVEHVAKINDMVVISPSLVSRILNNFPNDIDQTLPYPPQSISMLTQELHATIIGQDDGHDEEQEKARVRSHLLVLLNGLFATACAEILNESGDIHPEIIDILQLQDLLTKHTPQAKEIKKKFIHSYITQILIAAIFDNWSNDVKYMLAFFHRKVNHVELVNNTSQNIQNSLKRFSNSSSNNEKDNPIISSIKNELNTNIVAAFATRKASFFNTLKSGAKILGVINTDQTNTTHFLNALAVDGKVEDLFTTTDTINIIKAPKDIDAAVVTIFNQALVTKILTEKDFSTLFTPLGIEAEQIKLVYSPKKLDFIRQARNTEFALLVGKVKSEITLVAQDLLDKELSFRLDAMINDYSLYGKPIINHFVAYTDDDTLRECTSTAAIYFNDLFAASTPIELNQAINKLAIKISLTACAFIFNSEAKIQPAALNLLPKDNTSAKETLYEVFISNFLVTMLQHWFTNTAWKKAFLSNTLVGEDTLNSILDTLRRLLDTSLNKDFLTTVQAFPFNPDASKRVTEETFIISSKFSEISLDDITQTNIDALASKKKLIILADNSLTTLKTAYATLQAQHNNMQTQVEEFEKYAVIFSFNHDQRIENLPGWKNTLKNTLNSLEEKIKALETISTRLKNANNTVATIIEINQYNTEANDLIMRFKAAHQQTQYFINPKLEKRTAALPLIESLLKEYEFLLSDNFEFWDRRVKRFGGDDVMSSQGDEGSMPHKARCMRDALITEKNRRLSADLKLYLMLTEYKTEKQKETILHIFSWLNSSGKTLEFYAELIKPFLKVLEKDFYDTAQLQTIKNKITAFKTKHNTRYQLVSRSEAEAHTPPHANGLNRR